MGWLGPLSLALLACTVDPSGSAPDGPAAGPAAPVAPVIVQPPPSPHPPGLGLLDPGGVAWHWPTHSRALYTSLTGRPEMERLLAQVRAVDPGVPERLVDGPSEALYDTLPDWVPRWGVVPGEDGVEGHVYLWWNQERPAWEAWELWQAEGRAERRYRGGAAGRPDWLAVLAPEPWDPYRLGPPPRTVPARDDPRWWRRVLAARWLPAEAWGDALVLAGDPHPAAREEAGTWLWTAFQRPPSTARPSLPEGALAALVQALAAMPSAPDRGRAAWLAEQAAEPASAVAALPLLCDPDEHVAGRALGSLAPFLPDPALSPWLVHPLDLVRFPAENEWERRRADPPASPTPDPAVQAAITAAFHAQSCTPTFTGRYDLALWGPSLATDPVEVVLHDAAGGMVGRGSSAPRPSWTLGLVMAVTGPPATVDVIQRGGVTRFAVPPSEGAALALGCTASAPLPALDEDPARI